jgi:serine/threonine protein kinase
LLARGRLTIARASRILAQVAVALAHAHQRGVIHRDLKPSNVFILRRGGVKLLDFGLARATGATAIAELAPLSSISGTPAYMAPEQWRGERQDARTDIWAAGILYFEMLAGHHPYRGANVARLRERITSSRRMPRLPRHLANDAPAAARLIARALQKNPSERFASALALRAELAS